MIEFKDDVCVNDQWTCNSGFSFYSIFDQQNLASDADGILGIGTSLSSGPSFVMKLVDEGTIRKAIVGMYLSDDENSNLILGDYDASFVEGGEDGLKWLETTNDTEWQIAVTSAYFGDHNLYKHSFRQAVLHSGTELFGVIMADFT